MPVAESADEYIVSAGGKRRGQFYKYIFRSEKTAAAYKLQYTHVSS
jgi:hypothetical protein